MRAILFSPLRGTLRVWIFHPFAGFLCGLSVFLFFNMLCIWVWLAAVRLMGMGSVEAMFITLPVMLFLVANIYLLGLVVFEALIGFFFGSMGLLDSRPAMALASRIAMISSPQ
ncbi:hypothetical protein [Ahrensia sp. R2A130]|uniref:hypothetical protein n=1 Tax=Ahrensia sp. R2A130 TaxID=744979 RepID=UPI0012EA122B|nr:hypothetical protein [Ahrensia sp. R2A130]